jgi:hypothetical protein
MGVERYMGVFETFEYDGRIFGRYIIREKCPPAPRLSHCDEKYFILLHFDSIGGSSYSYLHEYFQRLRVSRKLIRVLGGSGILQCRC